MFDSIFQVLYLIGLVGMETIRFPYRMRNKRDRRAGKIQKEVASWFDITLELISFLGAEVIPLIYLFSTWLDFANYQLPAWLNWIGWLGAGIFAGALILLRKAHTDLGKNWSPSLQIVPDQHVVTTGIYATLRHPIYAAVWLSMIAQALLLNNWIAGLAGIVTFLPVYLVRVPKEERMMVEQFGQEYRDYMQHVGGIIPKWNRITK
jgi:protein-S-isoprenylcysteine O-methyltransferase Ste14